jgi:hypothetical protein
MEQALQRGVNRTQESSIALAETILRLVKEGG